LAINKDMNKYEKWYNNIIKNAGGRSRRKGYERHHIIPKSVGGTNDKSNIAFLTTREHFVCHWLLTKFYTGQALVKMLYALNGMKRDNGSQNRYHTKITSRVYARLREEFAKIHSQTMKGKPSPLKGKKLRTEEQKQNQREKMTGRKLTQEHIDKVVKARVGYKHSEETVNKISSSLTGVKRGPWSESEKLKRSVKQLGVKKEKSHCENIRSAVIGNISINKDGLEKKVKKDTLDSWIKEGWTVGGRKRKS
jgi:hypothetical protein